MKAAKVMLLSGDDYVLLIAAITIIVEGLNEGHDKVFHYSY